MIVPPSLDEGWEGEEREVDEEESGRGIIHSGAKVGTWARRPVCPYKSPCLSQPQLPC